MMLKCLSFFIFPVFAFSQIQSDTRLIADSQTASSIVSRSNTYELSYKSATDVKLSEWFETSNAAQQLEIGQELINRKSSQLFPIFISSLKQREVIPVTVGVISYDSNLASELYASVAYQKEKAQRKAYYQRTNSAGMQKELTRLFGRDYDTKWSLAETDAFLKKMANAAFAADDVAVQTLNSICYTNKFKHPDYARVKFFAQKYASAELLATLAQFKNATDLDFIASKNTNSYLAIAVNPQPKFFKILEENVDTDYDSADFQNAVASYKNSPSVKLLETVCLKMERSLLPKMERDDQLFALYSLIEAKNCKAYAAVLSKIDKLLK